MFDVMLYSSNISINLNDTKLEAKLFFCVPFSGFVITPIIEYEFKNCSKRTERLKHHNFAVEIKPDIVNGKGSFIIKGKRCTFEIPHKSDIKKLDITIEISADRYKGSIILKDVIWEELQRGFYIPSRQSIFRFMIEEEQREAFDSK